MIKLIAAFFSGVFLFNAIPHLVQGICGKQHMTPFSPSSSPAINVIWGWINMIVGIYLIRFSTMEPWNGLTCAVFCAGGFVTSLSLAIFWTNPEARLPWHKNG